MAGTQARRAGASIGGLVAGALASAALTGILALHVRAVVSGHVGPWQVDTLVEVAITAVGAIVAAWLAAGATLATVCLAVRAAGTSWRAGERLVHRYAPQVVRKALVLAVGAGIGLGLATGASATAPAPSPSVSVAAAEVVAPADLGWAVTTSSIATTTPVAPTPAAADTSSTPPPIEVAPEPTVTEPTVVEVTATATPAVEVSATEPRSPDTGTAVGTVVVVAGDSLWSIAARHLPPDATDAQIAAAWPRWYEANAGVIGADPGVIQPGQSLVVPASAVEPAL